ncbi:hypothetical protein DFH09DRAFT_1188230 [Mycena vulgaris]|nr:hypothetical protein DFH09DRAFT_1188230 [Mycena vulgaris]
MPTMVMEGARGISSAESFVISFSPGGQGGVGGPGGYGGTGGTGEGARADVKTGNVENLHLYLNSAAKCVASTVKSVCDHALHIYDHLCDYCDHLYHYDCGHLYHCCNHCNYCDTHLHLHYFRHFRVSCHCFFPTLCRVRCPTTTGCHGCTLSDHCSEKTKTPAQTHQGKPHPGATPAAPATEGGLKTGSIKGGVGGTGGKGCRGGEGGKGEGPRMIGKSFEELVKLCKISGGTGGGGGKGVEVGGKGGTGGAPVSC